MVYFYLFVVFLLVNYHFQVQLLFSARPHLKMPCLSSFKWKYCFRYPMPRFLYLEKMPDNWIMFVKMIGTIKDDWEVRFHIIRRKKIIRMYKWLDLYERRSDLWRRPSLRSFRQTKSLTSSAAGEYLCCRFSFATGFTKQATLPLLLAVEFKSDGVEPPNIMEAERPMCLFPASMLAVFICCSWPYSLRISSWKSKHDGTRISHKNLKPRGRSYPHLQLATHITRHILVVLLPLTFNKIRLGNGVPNEKCWAVLVRYNVVNIRRKVTVKQFLAVVSHAVQHSSN